MPDTTIDVCEVQPHELMSGLIDIIRETQNKIGYYEMKSLTKTHLDQVIEQTINKQERKLTDAEIVSLAAKLYSQIMLKSTMQALSCLSGYYADSKHMSRQELLSEKHKPKRLSRYMKATGQTRHSNVAAHAIVSGGHTNPEAKAARRILARWKIRIDDPDNGVFLPRDSRYVPHMNMPEAVTHSELHTREYYINVSSILSQTTTETECRLALRVIAEQLQSGKWKY